MVVDLARKIGIVLLCGLEDNLLYDQPHPLPMHVFLATDLGAIGELVSPQIDLAKAALADKPPQGITSHRLQVCRGEVTVCDCQCREKEVCARRMILLEELLV